MPPISRYCDRNEAESILLNCSQPQLSVFKELWWWNATSRAAHIGYDLLAIANHGDDVALMPLFKQSLPLVRRLGAPLRGTFTSGIGLRLLSANIDDHAACLQSVVRYAQTDLRANWMEFGYAVEEEPVAIQVHDSAAWQREEKYTFVIGLARDEESAWAAIESRARNKVRKAEKDGVRILKLDGGEGDIGQFYDMLKATFAKSGSVPPHSKRFYTTLVRELLEGGHMLFLGAELHGERVAFGMFPFNGHEMQYLSGTSSAAGNASAANSLIQWEAIRFAVNHGLRRYDLGGGGIANIDKFKMSFGGRPEIYARYTWMAPWLRGALSAYLKMRPVLQNIRTGFTSRW